MSTIKHIQDNQGNIRYVIVDGKRYSTRYNERKVCYYCGFWPWNKVVKIDKNLKICTECIKLNGLVVQGVTF